MVLTKTQKQRQIQLALEDAIDSMLTVIELTHAVDDRYRETMRKLREDDHKWSD